MSSFINFKKLANQFGDGTSQDPIPQVVETLKDPIVPPTGIKKPLISKPVVPNKAKPAL